MAALQVRFVLPASGNINVIELRVALFNALFARKHEGNFFLRLETIETSTEENLKKISEDLTELGFSWVKQGENSPQLSQIELARKLCEEALQKLLQEGKAYPCYCSSEKLEEERRRFLAQGRPVRYVGTCRSLNPEQRAEFEAQGKKPVYRLKVDRQIVRMKDIIQGDLNFDTENLGDFILVKHDGSFIQSFASALEDHHQKISHVIRSEDQNQHTPQQILLLRMLGHIIPEYAHVPLLLGSDKTLLSKKEGVPTLAFLREAGYLSQTIVHYFSLLGLTAPHPRGAVGWEELTKRFELEKVSRTSPTLEWEKLKALNLFYLREMPFEDYYLLASQKVKNFEKMKSKKSESWMQEALGVYQNICPTFLDLEGVLKIILEPLSPFEEAAKKHLSMKDAAKLLKFAREDILALEPFEREGLKEIFENLKTKIKSKNINYLAPLRVAITGEGSGFDLSLYAFFMGKEEVVRRIDYALATVQHLKAN